MAEVSISVQRFDLGCMVCARVAGEAAAWVKRLATCVNVVPKLQQSLKNTSKRNGLSVLALPGEAGLACPAAVSFPRVGSLFTFWTKLGVYSLDPRGANHPVHGLADLGRERFQSFWG